jgi:hypothetical protein
MSLTFLESNRRKCTIEHSSFLVGKGRLLHIYLAAIDLGFGVVIHGAGLALFLQRRSNLDGLVPGKK